MERTISEVIAKSVNKSIDDIINVPVEKISFDASVPLDDEITDSNKVHKGKVSVLFVDMRNSTQFTDDNSAKTVVKVYRSLIKTITRAIRLCNGNVRDFMGDGVLAVFADKVIDNKTVDSAIQAVEAGKCILTFIDYFLNPKLKNKFDLTVKCGVGICTGDVLATKVGLRGNEKNNDLENETGIIWIGACTNYASKFCSMAQSGEIVVDMKTYSKLVGSDKWRHVERINDGKVYDCYISKNNYLAINTEETPLSVCDETNVDDSNEHVDILDFISQRMDEYDEKLREYNSKLEEFKEKDKYLIQREKTLREQKISQDGTEILLDERKELLDEGYYQYYSSIISHAHCKAAYIKECGENFWDDILIKAIDTGEKIGKTELDVKKELCYALVYIYQTLLSWEKAYDFLCIQAKYHTWIHASTVKDVINNSNHWITIKNIIENRIKENEFTYSTGKYLKECLEVISNLGY